MLSLAETYDMRSPAHGLAHQTALKSASKTVGRKHLTASNKLVSKIILNRTSGELLTSLFHT
jgi:hypothetical protein